MPGNSQRNHIILASATSCLLVVLAAAGLSSPPHVKAEDGESGDNTPAQNADATGESGFSNLASASESLAEFGTQTETAPGQQTPVTVLYEPVSEASASDKDNPIPPESDISSDKSPAWVANLDAAQNASQLVIVEALEGTGCEAVLSFHERDENGIWHEQLGGIRALVGEDGIGQASEGAKVTPAGSYALPSAFGLEANPGTELPYTQVGEDHYWVSDTSSPWYNQLVSEQDVSDFDKDAGEHLVDSGQAYDYAIEIGYNEEHVPGAGSAFFINIAVDTPSSGLAIAGPRRGGNGVAHIV